MRRPSAWILGASLACLASAPKHAFGDDLADEADLQFSLGASAYKQGDYTGALEHFLASNRLVPNRNVIFNIARTYQDLKLFPEAFRYYTLALEQEHDGAARAKIEQALAAIRSNVAVLRVVSIPSGATLYVDRRDLGPRGSTPRLLGLAPGHYKLIAELPGYEPREVEVSDASAGRELEVTLKLTQILGRVRVNGPAGASVHVDREPAAPSCTLPCELDLSPGKHRLLVRRPGFRVAELVVEVVAHETAEVDARLEPLTGNVVVSTDEPRALIEVDGRPREFTPAILNLPVGPHEFVITLKGFRNVERTLEVQRDKETRLDLVLLRSEEITAASRVSEQVEDAPSSVSVIARPELRALSYPTIAEALRGTPGVYLSDDRSYVTLGMRGLGRLGGYGNRVLVLQDGQPLNDDWLGSSYVGFDALADLGDVERIEVVRGPGSVLYGTNAFSGVINLVNQKPGQTGTSVGVATSLDGVASARVRSDVRFGANGGAWMSLAVARGQGRNFFFPEYAASARPGSDGVARDVDGFRAATLHGGAFWQAFSAQWSLHSHAKHLPTAEYDTSFGDPRTRQVDTRSFVELKFEPKLSEKVTLLSRVHLNHYEFRGEYGREANNGGLEVDTFRGSWVGLEERLQVDPTSFLRLTAGGEGQSHFQVEQRGRTDDGYFLDDSGPRARPFWLAALYALVDAGLGEHARLSLGARLDTYSTFGSSLNPRAALVLQPYPAGNTKILGGKAFRAPSIYELYYNDGGYTQIQSPNLEPESIYSLEIEHSHRFSPTLVGSASVYANYVLNIITPRGGDADHPLQYANENTPLSVVGTELSLRREFRQGFMLSVSLGLSHALFLREKSLGAWLGQKRDPNKRHVENSPVELASFKAAVPIVSRALLAATRLTLEGQRYDRNEDSDEPAQGRSAGAAIWDIVLSGEESRFGLRYAFGVYNAFDWRYQVPVSAEFLQRTIEQAGRTFLASTDLRF